MARRRPNVPNAPAPKPAARRRTLAVVDRLADVSADVPLPERWLTDHELARVLNVSQGFLREDRITAKRIPFIKVGTHMVRYDLGAVRRALTRASTIKNRRAAG